MDVSANTNMDVSGVGQTPSVDKIPELQPVNRAERPIKPAQISRSDVEQMVEALKDLTETLQTKTSLNFSVDEGTNDIVVKVVERGTDKVIRQIPPEELLELQEKMQDLTGFLFDSNA